MLNEYKDKIELQKEVLAALPRNNNKNNKLYKAKVEEIYNLEPKQLIEVKGLQGDTSDNIPGVPGIGEKTALKLIQEYKNIENLYKLLEEGKAEEYVRENPLYSLIFEGLY